MISEILLTQSKNWTSDSKTGEHEAKRWSIYNSDHKCLTIPKTTNN